MRLRDDYKELVAHLEKSGVQLRDSAGLQLLCKAVVAGEDRRFWKHRGFDLIAIARAISFFVLRRKLSGASTIEQQLVRTIRERYDVTFSRKISEIVLAVLIAQRFSKKHILLSYLEIAYLGWRARGVNQAASRLNATIDNLNISNAATIAAMLKLPMPRRPSNAYLCRLEKRKKHIISITLNENQ